MTNEDFELHLKNIVDGRMSILLDNTIDDDVKKTKLSIYDKENDELNQSIDIYYRLVDFEGFTLYSSLMDTKADTTALDELSATLDTKLDTTALDELSTIVDTKADTTALDALSATVDTKADTTALDELSTTVDTKADTTALPNFSLYALKSDIPDSSSLTFTEYIPEFPFVVGSNLSIYNGSQVLFSMDNNGYVFAKGSLIGTTDSTPLFTLPLAFRPLTRRLICCSFYNGSSYTIDIDTNGVVYARGVPSTGHAFNLNLSYRAGF